MTKKELATFRASYTAYTKPCVCEGLQLAVHYDEKDEVKQYGGRWDAGKNTWWMPVEALNTTKLNWLNDNKMIVGQYGDIDADLCNDYACTVTSKGIFAMVYTLVNDKQSNGPQEITVQKWTEMDAVNFIGDGNKWLSLEDGRNVWDELVKQGYNNAMDKVSWRMPIE